MLHETDVFFAIAEAMLGDDSTGSNSEK
jgi:hypothetical protein